MQTCKRCGIEKPLSEYYTSTRTTSGYRGTCKQCAHEQYKARYAKTKTFVGNNKKNLPLPSQERLMELFEYNGDGGLKRLVSAGNQKAGIIAYGKREKCGRRRLLVDGEHYLFHRVLWKLIYGNEPKFIDHINQDPSDNRIENLRQVDKCSNSRHQKLPINNTSGFFGVSWHADMGKWVSKICVNSKKVHAGYHTNIKDAVLAYNEKCNELHGEFGKSKIIHSMEELKRRGLI
jgi:hypothetical protein